MKKDSPSVYRSELLAGVPHLVHGFSTAQSGDMKDPVILRAFIQSFGLPVDSYIWMDQIHGNRICDISEGHRGNAVTGYDGIVYTHSSSGRHPTLCVHVADCTPILAVDPSERIIGVAHAGWAGTVGHIAGNLMRAMKKNGAHPSDILVCLGPHIGPCCYAVDSERADRFINEFGKSGVVTQKGNTKYADIGLASYLDILGEGIPGDHIDFDRTVCTQCTGNEFFSYRRSGRAGLRELAGIIAWAD